MTTFRGMLIGGLVAPGLAACSATGTGGYASGNGASGGAGGTDTATGTAGSNTSGTGVR